MIVGDRREREKKKDRMSGKRVQCIATAVLYSTVVQSIRHQRQKFERENSLRNSPASCWTLVDNK